MTYRMRVSGRRTIIARSGFALMAAVLAALQSGGAPVYGVDTAVPPEWPVAEIGKLLGPPERPAEVPPETARLLSELVSENFAVRDRASKELETRGPDAFPHLRALVALSGDSELIARTAKYFRAGMFQVPVNVPKKVTTVLRMQEPRQADGRNNVLRVGELKNRADIMAGQLPQDEIGEIALQIARAQEPSEELRLVLDRAILTRSGIRARLAIARGRWEEAENILREAIGISPDADEDLAALAVMREGATLDVDKTLERLKLEGDARVRMAALLYRNKGNLARAADFVMQIKEKKAPEYSAERILIDAGRYADLIRFTEGMRREYTDLPRLAAWWLIGDELALKDDLNQLIWQTGRGENSEAAYRIPIDQVEQALASIDPAQDTTGLRFHILCEQLRIREALATITDRKKAPMDFARHLSAMGLHEAARSLLKDIVPEEGGRARNPRRDLFYYAANWELAGDAASAAKARERGYEVYGPAEGKRIESLREQDKVPTGPILKTPGGTLNIAGARSTFRPDVELPINGASFLGNPAVRTIPDIAEVNTWFGSILSTETPEKPDLKARFEKAIRIMEGKLSGEECAALVSTLLSVLKPEWDWKAQSKYVAIAVKRLHAMQRDDLAVHLVERLAESQGDPSCWSVLGDMYLENGRPAEAVEYFRRAAVVNLTKGSLMYRMGLGLSRAGKVEEGSAMMAFAPMLVLSDYEQALALAAAIEKFESKAKSDEWFREYARRFTRWDLQYYFKALMPAIQAAEERGDYAGAFDVQKKMHFSIPFNQGDFSYDRISAMPTVANFHRLRALEAWTRKDFATVADALWRQMDNGAPDVVTLEKVLPALKNADVAAAMRILDRAIGRVKPVVDDYPDATRYREQLVRLERLR